MKPANKIITLLFLLIIFGCTEESIIESDLVYKEKVVINSRIYTGQLFNGVSFTKTLPTTDIYDIKDAEIKEVYAYLKINRGSVLPLHYYKEGTYKPYFNIIPKANDLFELYANVNNKNIYASSLVPGKPEIVSYNINKDNRLEVTVLADSGIVYCVGYKLNKVDNYNFTSFRKNKSVVPEEIKIYSDFIPEEAIRQGTNMYMRVFAFDESFADYYKTKDNNLPNDNVFSESGGPIVWNVNAKDVIGMFIGYSMSDWIYIRQNP